MMVLTALMSEFFPAPLALHAIETAAPPKSAPMKTQPVAIEAPAIRPPMWTLGKS